MNDVEPFQNRPGTTPARHAGIVRGGAANDLERLLRRHLDDWQSGWSMGSFGAIAEFHQDEGEIAVVDEPAALTRATRRGAIRISRGRIADIVPVAYETLSPKRHRWTQALALCLSDSAARLSARDALTELGPDDDAIRGIDRTGILFDMGLSLPQCDFCIRTSDPKLLAELRANLGRSVFDPANTAMPAILSAHPHRVAITNVGRVEVYQKIGGPDTGGVSPPGPHTHLLPKILRSRRTHSANTPIPDGFAPVGYLHPGNPVIGAMGEDRAFSTDLFDDFQALLDRYGRRDMTTVKAATFAALAKGLGPDALAEPKSRFGRAAVRLALRQQRHLAELAGDEARLDLLGRWLAVHEGDAETEDDDAPGH